MGKINWRHDRHRADRARDRILRRHGLAMARHSNDPIAMMQTVGTVSGAVGAFCAAMTVIGVIGR
jgi:very-short-patch-repair endonuclease